ncbi:thioredoxin [Okeania sp. SIO2B3]|uniref:thioredoxin n=1 Tax=Okeania sp. SIO2B3 TaxID=2607784 RepID=UPI0013BFE2CE|nr:thioredoxin [Okeania sp. SIO2B3]NET43670.1 thioredoxin [Okeania sp. SIO2B3]
MSTATYINDSEFNALLTSETIFVVDCTASWCGPCKKISPYIDQLAEEYEGRAKVVKLDISENKETANKFSIRSIPAVMFFKSGELVENIVGVSPYETFKAALDKLL